MFELTLRLRRALRQVTLRCGVSGFALIAGTTACTIASPAAAQQKLHYSYLWHMEQPIYWPDQQVSGADRYERAWESILRRDAGAVHPTNNLRDIFGLPDRVAGYQYRMRDSINALRWTAEGGAQISYSGGLIENVQSLADASQLGYSAGWYNSLREARNWTTNGANAKPRADIVVFPFHHALLPLVDENTVRKEIQLYKSIYPDAWGTVPGVSRGLFPSEMAFSTRLIKVLAEEGIAWSIVSAEKLSRACADFPVTLGSGGINTDPPNKADQLNPAQGVANYYRQSISRGCSPAEAYPFSLTPRRARYIDPATGNASSIIVVPSSQSLSWRDGYAPIGTGDFDALNARNDGSRPMLVLLAHDGDNAWGGGYSYYMEATPNLASQAVASGYVPTTIERYLADHPVPANDFVHVEDGAWVNADGDFGAPQFINWNWPLLSASGQIDVENGWHEDARNWAVVTAAQNYVDTAERIATRPGGPQPGGLNIRKILYPDAAASSAERAWHYFLGALNSGYMYYGTAEDFEVKPTIACNEAIEHASAIIVPALQGDPSLDTTPPSIWTVQRHPWNPGSTNFGPQYGYQSRGNDGDFWVWSFVSDVSGVANVTLKYRVDLDGQRSLSNTENETYAGGAGVGGWQSLSMTRRVFPAGNVYNNPTLNFFEMPQQIADQYHAKIVGLRSKLVDYYMEAVDSRGNIKRSPIEHVWIGDGSGAGGGGGTGSPTVAITPPAPVAGQQVTVTYAAGGGPLAAASPVHMHFGFNNWSQVNGADPAMTLISSGTSIGNVWSISVPIPTNASQLDCVFNNASGVWDNNGGQDWHFTVTGAPPVQTWTMDGARDSAAKLVATNAAGNVGGSVQLWAGLIGDILYVAANDAGEGNDNFIYLAGSNQSGPGPLRASQWAKAGQVASWDAFLADENSNDYEGWFDAPAGSAAMTGPNGGVLEGTINLRTEWGLSANAPLPEFVYLAFGAFGNPDGGALVASAQAPITTNGNGNIEATEYVRVRLCELAQTGCSPVCNDLDFNNDGNIDPSDVDSYFQVLGEGPCLGSPVCDSLDFNNDGNIDPADVDAYFSVLGEGPCTR